MPLTLRPFLALLVGACALAQGPVPQSAVRPTVVLNAPDTGQRLSVSVLDAPEAQACFNDLAERLDIPHGYLADGAHARAHKMVRILDDKDITAAKAWVLGDIYMDSKLFGEVGLIFHVAPVVYVRMGEAPILCVLDPSLFDRPVPHATWKAKLLAKSKAKLQRAYFSSRFAYDPEDRTKVLTAYELDALNDMDATNRTFGRKLYALELLKGSAAR
jgi:hypothetical protein